MDTTYLLGLTLPLGSINVVIEKEAQRGTEIRLRNGDDRLQGQEKSKTSTSPTPHLPCRSRAHSSNLLIAHVVSFPTDFICPFCGRQIDHAVVFDLAGATASKAPAAGKRFCLLPTGRCASHLFSFSIASCAGFTLRRRRVTSSGLFLASCALKMIKLTLAVILCSTLLECAAAPLAAPIDDSASAQQCRKTQVVVL